MVLQYLARTAAHPSASTACWRLRLCWSIMSHCTASSEKHKETLQIFPLCQQIHPAPPAFSGSQDYFWQKLLWERPHCMRHVEQPGVYIHTPNTKIMFWGLFLTKWTQRVKLCTRQQGQGFIPHTMQSTNTIPECSWMSTSQSSANSSAYPPPLERRENLQQMHKSF